MADQTQAAPAAKRASARRWRRRRLALALVVRFLLILAAAVALLPFLALARGTVMAIQLGLNSAHTLGVALSLSALLLGSLFFLYSVRYYMATLVMLLSSVVLTDGNGYSNGNGHGNHHPHGLMRLLRRGNGNGAANGNGNGNGHFDLGYEPFVSIHIATYNERRVIGRLLEGCAALEYGNYEVIVVDDSTDETTSILATWQARPGFKLIHRESRDGFKGGALQVALQHMDPRAEFVIVWDADVVPFPDSIQTFLPHFYKTNGNGNGEGAHAPEPRREVAAVQSYQWHVLNKSESWLTEAVRAEYAGSYMVERPFQEFIGSLKMIAGTAYMIRASLLRQLGWGRSLTEDWELTLRLHARGYKVVYTPYAESPAECVATFGRLARQRMRWAEGHSYNVRRWFGAMMRSPHLGFVEKVEFLYDSTYYLQAALFVVGSAAWLFSEIALRAHVPEWTAVLGWSLLLSNLLSLPLMNFAGLLLEGAPVKDFFGILGALATSFLLVPFQAYAALKGLLERDEGPWYRTPKTGRVTDPVRHLRRLQWLRKWLGPLQRTGRAELPVQATALPRRRPPRRLGWIVVGALLLAVGGLGYGALRAPVARAANTPFYMHDPALRHMDNTLPGPGAPITFSMANADDIFTWSTPSATLASQTIDSSTTFQFNYWTTGAGGATSTADLTFGYSATPDCMQIAWVQNKTNVNTGTTLTGTLAKAVNAGDLLVGIFRATTAPPTVTDNVNGAWTEIGFNGTVSMWYRQNSGAAAAGGLTVTLGSAAAGTIRMSVDEFAGVATAASLDQTTNAATATTTWTAAASAAIPGGELVYAGIGTQTNNENATAGTTNGAVMTLGGQQTSPADGTIASEYLQSAVAGSQNSSLTLSAPPVGAFSGVQATFKTPAGSITPIASSNGVPLTVSGAGGLFTGTFSPASNVVVPAGSYFCYTVRITAVTGGGLTLDVDDSLTPTALISSQTIFIPEMVLPLLGISVLIPVAGRVRRSHKKQGRGL